MVRSFLFGFVALVYSSVTLVLGCALRSSGFRRVFHEV